MEPQCKTKADVLDHAARCLRQFGDDALCCVNGYTVQLMDCDLKANPNEYEFPLAEVEGELVWRGNKPYVNERQIEAHHTSIAGMVFDTEGNAWWSSQLSWNPPRNPPRRTVNVNGTELVLPDRHLISPFGYPLIVNNCREVRFSKREDRDAWVDKISSLLEDKQ